MQRGISAFDDSEEDVRGLESDEDFEENAYLSLSIWNFNFGD